jgi:trehalose/maltose hydrolase-like predicted phosphorylase
MDILPGLTILGNALNNTRIEDKKKEYRSYHKKTNKINENIYNSNNINNNEKKIQGMAKKRFEDATNPNSGIFSKNISKTLSGRKKIQINENFGLVGNFDSDSDFSDDNNSHSESCSDKNLTCNGDPDFFINQCNNINNNKKYENKIIDKQHNDSYIEQFGDLKFDQKGRPNYSNPFNGITNTSTTSRTETERRLLSGGFTNFNENKNMTYGIVPENKLFHNNMIPNFKGASYGGNPLREKNTRNLNQRKLELFIGSANDPQFRPKTESKPLFSPLTGVTNIYGTPNLNDFYETRYIPGKERRNELPFKQQRISPGLGLGSNEIGQQGYNTSAVRILPKDTNELRTLNNPKISYGGIVVPGMKGQRGPVSGAVAKRQPDKFVEWGTTRMLPSLGYILAPKVTGDYDPKTLGTENRGLLRRTQYGAAKFAVAQATPEALIEKVKETTRQGFKQAEPRNVILVEGLQARGNTNSYFAKLKNRAVQNQYDRAGVAVTGDAHKGQITNYNDVASITKRTVQNEYDRAGVAVTGDVYKGQATNYNDVANMTKRTVQNQYDRAGVAVTGDAHKGQATDYNDVANMTKRTVQNQYDRAGVAVTGDMHKGQAVDYNDVVNMTKRTVQNQYDRAGLAVRGDAYKGQAIDYNDIADITKRTVQNKYDRSGVAVTGDMHKGQAVDYNDIADITKRTVQNKYDRAGVAVTGDIYKGQAVDYNDVADITRRTVQNQYDRAGAAVTGDAYKGQATDYNDVANMTKRTVQNQYDRAGVAISGDIYKGQAIDYNDVANMTKRTVQNQYDRAGVGITGDAHKGQATDYNDVTNITRRTVQNQYDRAGVGITGDAYKGQAVDYNDVASITKRTVQNQYDRAGVGITGDAYKGQAIDYNDVASMTKRTINNKYDRAGLGITGDAYKNRAVDYNDIPDITKREIHSKLNRSGGGAQGQDQQKSYVINYIDSTPEITKREMHSKLNRSGGGAQGQDQKKSYVINYIDYTPEITKREIHSELNRSGGGAIEQQSGKMMSRGDVLNMVINTAREKIAKGRAPTLSNTDMGPTMDFTLVRVCDKIQINRALIPRTLETNDQLPYQMTHMPVNRTIDQNRMGSYIKNNLEGNPYINNMLYKSI